MALQPGQELWNLIQGGLRAQGKTVASWCRANEVNTDWARQACRGERDGAAARKLRARMARAAGITPLEQVPFQSPEGEPQSKRAAKDDGVEPPQLPLLGGGGGMNTQLQMNLLDGWKLEVRTDEILIYLPIFGGFRWFGGKAPLIDALRAVVAAPSSRRTLKEDDAILAELEGGHIWVQISTPTLHMNIPVAVILQVLNALGGEG